MDFSASHVSFVIAAYAASFMGLAGLVILIFRRDRKLKREVAALDRDKIRTP
jgi:heme exporter protein CcmD